jgi:hypothetical protein
LLKATKFWPKSTRVKFSQFSRTATGPVAVVLWAFLVTTGMVWMVRYQMTPGAQASELPSRWPANVSFTPNDHGWTLVMMLHPQCPCSRASIHELSELISRSAGNITAHILFVQPPGAPAGWCDGALWSAAKQLPGVSVAVDANARDATIFGATTSGEVLLYDSAGMLRFGGGITDGRGHEGDNAGYLAILSLIRGEQANVASAPVYGCSLGVCRPKPKSN